MESSKHKKFFRHTLSIPFIYMMVVPVIILDVMLEIYHRVAFVLYGLTYVERGRYIKIDRHKLRYLSLVQKMNCMYCGYVNGFFAYAVEVAGRTEKYWCGIQHAKDPHFKAPVHHTDFLPYGDKDAFEEFMKK